MDYPNIDFIPCSTYTDQMPTCKVLLPSSSIKSSRKRLPRALHAGICYFSSVLEATLLTSRLWYDCRNQPFNSKTPFTRYNMLSNRFYNRLDVCLYDAAGWQPAASCKQTYRRFDNRFDNRLYRVNGVLVFHCVSLKTTQQNKDWPFYYSVIHFHADS